MESGKTQRRYDTFVMTGDMILKTTSTNKIALALSNVATCPFSDPPQKPEKCNIPVAKKDALNGSEAMIQYNEQSSVESDPIKSPQILLDIPPNDISSDDEKFNYSHVDIDIDALPPPPKELLSDHVGKDNQSIKTVLPEPHISSEANENGVIGTSPVAINCSPFTGWHDSLDAVIAQLEVETAFVGQLSTQCGGYGSEPVSVALNHEAENGGEIPLSGSTKQLSSTTNDWPVSSSSLVGKFRTTKSQENCLQYGNEFSSLMQLDIDSAGGKSASVEVLHHELSADALLNKLPYRSVLKESIEETSGFDHESDQTTANNSPWWEVPVSTSDQTVDCISGHLQETPDVHSHMQECYLVCPKSSNIEVTSNGCDTALLPNSSPSKKAVKSKPKDKDQSLVSRTVLSAQESACDSSSDIATGAPVVDEIGRPQQMKEIDKPSAIRLAKRLYHLDGFRKCDVAKHLSKKNDFSFLVGEQYVRYFDFTGLTLDSALRVFLRQLVLTGETQERERILAHFSHRYIECNPHVYNSEDACHTLTCAIMLLNTDLHKQNTGRRMTVSEFIDNLADLNDGENFPRPLLCDIYRSIRDEPMEFEMDPTETGGVGLSNESDLLTGQITLGVGNNPFLTVPDPSQTVEYKKGYIMRKCCTDPDGRKTSLGRRGWKMWYAVLCDMILYIYKDERSYKQNVMVNYTNNAIHVYHALATYATNYKKKQHVFWLQTADWSQYLFQTSNSEDCQKWIDAINYAASSLSAPPLPGACGSQKKFQRPLMPSSYTRLSLKDQLVQHETYLADVERDLTELVKNPPERGAKARLIKEYIEREKYLQFEQRRFKTYCLLLHSRMFTLTVVDQKGAVQDLSSVRRSPISEVDEMTSAKEAKSSVIGVSRSISDRSVKPRRIFHSNSKKQSRAFTTHSCSLQSAMSMPVMYETRV